MATKITNAALIAAGKELLTYAKGTTVPYVAGGMTLAGMDCQGLVEYLLIRCGVPKAECNLAGSNAHYRACLWVGTPEECKKAFGSIPGGAALFILEASGGEPAKYRADGIGNASHIGLWLGDTSIAASASRGQVIESNFAGKTINGGWNRVGLLPWVNYGLSESQQALLTGDDGEDTGDAGDTDAEAEEAAASAKIPDVSQFYTVKRGCKGGAVRRLQKWLNALYLNEHEVAVTSEMLVEDGEFGPKTDAAVRAFQETRGLTVDGVVGRKTWQALVEARAQAAGEAQG